jgi:hypothetical protein
LERLGDLALIDAVEEMAVVNKEAGSASLPQADFGQHEIEAEDLHVGDALAPLPIDMDLELGTTAGLGNRKASGLLVEGFRQRLEGKNGIANDVTTLMDVVAQRLRQVRALDVELGLGLSIRSAVSRRWRSPSTSASARPASSRKLV